MVGPLIAPYGSGAVTLDPNIAFAHPCAGDIVGRLHPHERVHLDAEAFSMRNAMVPDKSERPLRNVDSAGRETPIRSQRRRRSG